MPKPKRTAKKDRWKGAIWDPQQELWMEDSSGQPEPYSETWPTSGTMRSGKLYPLPVSEPPTSATESSLLDSQLLPTPVTEPNTGNGHARNLGKEINHLPEKLLPTPANDEFPKNSSGEWSRHSPALTAVDYHFPDADPLLPTPMGRDYKGAPSNGYCDPSLPKEVELLPTPMTTDHKLNSSQSNMDRHSPPLGAIEHYLPTPLARDVKGGMAHQPDLNDALKALPIPRSTDSAGLGVHGQGGMDLRTTVIVDESQWGKYAPAIARWESLTRPAPAPTEPNTKGNPRLSAAFSQWMMGWPEGWVTQVEGISRSEQLKCIGNGVVPQQAVAALTGLLGVLAGVQVDTTEHLGDDALIPTPRASDSGPRGGTTGYGMRNWTREYIREHEENLLPTPRVAADRTSRTAATRADSRSGPSLEQATEIACGELPREFQTWDELPASWQPLLPTPQTRDAHAGPASEVGGTRASGQPRQKDLNTVAARELGFTPLQEAFRKMDEQQRIKLAGHLDTVMSTLDRLSDDEIDTIPKELLGSLIDLIGFCEAY